MFHVDSYNLIHSHSSTRGLVRRFGEDPIGEPRDVSLSGRFEGPGQAKRQ